MPTRKKKSERDVRSLARDHTAMAVNVLAGIASSKQAQTGARVSAATALLDRGWGRPEQHTSVDVTHDVTAFLRELQGAVIDAQAESLDDQGMQLEHSPDTDMVIEVGAEVMAGEADD